MKKIFIINAHQYWKGISEGNLNRALVNLIREELEAKGCEIKLTEVDKGYEIQEELDKHMWADVIIVQMPVNWMGQPWKFKKYIDEVYSSGLMVQLCNTDGRHRTDPKKGYGSGGCLKNTKYMLSLTFNAPLEAFNDPNEYLFQGKSVDDLMFPQHMNFRFFAMQALPTFACHDVLKNPQIESDMQRLKEHLNCIFG